MTTTTLTTQWQLSWEGRGWPACTRPPLPPPPPALCCQLKVAQLTRMDSHYLAARRVLLSGEEGSAVRHPLVWTCPRGAAEPTDQAALGLRVSQIMPSFFTPVSIEKTRGRASVHTWTKQAGVGF